ncbi:MAG: hypothetical protein GC205_11535 [Bacteroidetes bacterium]|nr:hypothetical protein [Bacteroidota bacterium]
MKHSIALALLCFSLGSRAQPEAFGPRATGLAGAVVADNSPWAGFANPAGLAAIDRFSAALAVDRRAWLPGLETFGAGLTLPAEFGCIGLIFRQFGYSFYREQSASLLFARRFGPQWSIGIGLDYLRLSLADYGRRQTITGQAGLLYQPFNQLTVGMRIYNPFQAALSEDGQENWPTLFSLGASYAPAQNLSVKTQVDKSLEGPLRVRCGLDYEVMESLRLRVGFSTEPATPQAGIGYRLKALDLDLGAGFHPYLGVIPAVGFCWPAQKPEP